MILLIASLSNIENKLVLSVLNVNNRHASGPACSFHFFCRLIGSIVLLVQPSIFRCRQYVVLKNVTSLWLVSNSSCIPRSIRLSKPPRGMSSSSSPSAILVLHERENDVALFEKNYGVRYCARQPARATPTPAGRWQTKRSVLAHGGITRSRSS